MLGSQRDQFLGHSRCEGQLADPTNAGAADMVHASSSGRRVCHAHREGRVDAAGVSVSEFFDNVAVAEGFCGLEKRRGIGSSRMEATSLVGRTILQLVKLWKLKNIATIKDKTRADTLLLMNSELEKLGAAKNFTQFEIEAPGFPDRTKELINSQEIRLRLDCVGVMSA